MSFLKFWTSSKKGGKKDDHLEANQDPELEKRRLRHSLSISRSGRFKQRKRERSQIMDKPEIFGGCADDANHPTTSVSGSSGSSTSSFTSSTSSLSSSQSNADNNRNNNGGGVGSGGSNMAAVNPYSHQSHYHSQDKSPKFNCRNLNSSRGLRVGHPVVT